MQKNIKILYIISTLKNSGPVNQLYSLIKNMDKDRFKPNILTLFSEPTDSKISEFQKLNVNVSSLELSRLNIFLKKRKFKKVIKKINPCIIHTHGFIPDIISSLFLKRFKHCNTIHNYAFDDYTKKYSTSLGTLMAFIYTNILKKIDYPIACSNYIAKKLKSKHNISTKVIQNGVNKDIFHPINNHKKEKLREKLNLDIKKKIFVSVGSLSSRKNQSMLIKAFKLANIEDETLLLLLGGGPKKNNYKELIEDESIVLRGKVNNVDEYLKASDVFVSASKSEGLPLATLEAMGTGLPVLLSDIEPHKEILYEGDFGDYFALKNVDELTKYFKLYTNKNTNKLGLKSRETLENVFSAKVMTEEYQNFYKKILKKDVCY